MLHRFTRGLLYAPNFGLSSELGVNEGKRALFVSFLSYYFSVPSLLPFWDPSSFFSGVVRGFALILHICSFLWYKPGNLPHRWPSSFSWYRCGSPHPSIFASTSLIFQSWGNSQPLLYVELIGIIRDGVHVEQFFKNFKENFRGSPYNSPRAPICEQIQTLISDTIVDRVSTSVLAVWAELEKYVPPFLISLPSLCNLQNSASIMKSAYIYHNLGLAVTSAARSQGGSCVPIYRWPSYWSVVRFPCRIQSTS